MTDNICVDWSNTLHKNPHLDRELDLTKRIPFGNDEFDTIILSDVLEHIPVPEDLWKEMARLLAKNGKIIMNVPFYYWLHEQPHDFYRYTEFALQRFAEISGMRLIELTPIGGAPEILADVIGKNILRLPKLGPAAALIVQWCVWNLIKTRLGRKVSKATSSAFSAGIFPHCGKAVLNHAGSLVTCGCGKCGQPAGYPNFCAMLRICSSFPPINRLLYQRA